VAQSTTARVFVLYSSVTEIGECGADEEIDPPLWQGARTTDERNPQALNLDSDWGASYAKHAVRIQPAASL